MPRRSARRPVCDTVPEAPLTASCALCDRPIPDGARASRHHLTPWLKGGTHGPIVRLHHVCHAAIHARFTEAELARHLADLPALRTAPALAAFLAWIRTKPDDFHAPTRRAHARTAKWR